MSMRTSFFLLLLLVVALPVAADARLTSSVTDPDGTSTTKSTWFAGEQIREDSGDRTVIVDLAADTVLLVDHRAKTYNRLDLPVDVAAMLPETARAAYESMLERMAMEVEVSPAVETADVGGYAATRFDVTLSSSMGTMVMELWMSEAVPVDIARYKAMMIELAGLQPAAGAWMERILELDGYPVRTINRAEIGGKTVEMVEQLDSIENLDPPAGHYAAPAGYREEPFDPLGDMRGGGR